jgi:hypothetical protein
MMAGTTTGLLSGVAVELDRVADVEGEAPVLVLDYLQHAARRRADSDPRPVVARISDEVGERLRRTGSSALLVSSTARHNYARSHEGTVRGARDFVGAAKESGDLEYDCGYVLVLEVDFSPRAQSLGCKLHVAKSRFGPTGGSIGLRFFPRVGIFRHDPAALVTGADAEIVEAVRGGAESAAKVLEEIGGRKQYVQKRIKELVRVGDLEGPPLQVREVEAGSRLGTAVAEGDLLAGFAGTGSHPVGVGAEPVEV